MRPQKITLSLFLMGLLLSAVVAFSAVMCLNDAFSLGADLRVLLLCAVLFAVLSTALMLPKGLWPSLAVAVAAADRNCVSYGCPEKLSPAPAGAGGIRKEERL